MTTTQKNTIHRTWERAGYTLSTITQDGVTDYVCTSPKGALEMHVVDYFDTPDVAFELASTDDMNSDEAREYAEKFDTACEVADFFQATINALRDAQS